jgi:hypothetical protein
VTASGQSRNAVLRNDPRPAVGLDDDLYVTASGQSQYAVLRSGPRPAVGLDGDHDMTASGQSQNAVFRNGPRPVVRLDSDHYVVTQTDPADPIYVDPAWPHATGASGAGGERGRVTGDAAQSEGPQSVFSRPAGSAAATRYAATETVYHKFLNVARSESTT